MSKQSCALDSLSPFYFASHWDKRTLFSRARCFKPRTRRQRQCGCRVGNFAIEQNRKSPQPRHRSLRRLAWLRYSRLGLRAETPREICSHGRKISLHDKCNYSKSRIPISAGRWQEIPLFLSFINHISIACIQSTESFKWTWDDGWKQ